MKPSQPMMSAAQAARALGKKTYEALVEAGDICPVIDECGVVRVPIEEVEHCLSRRETGAAAGGTPSITIIERECFPKVKEWLSIDDAEWKILEQHCADPRVEFLVLLLAGRRPRLLAASRTDLQATVRDALKIGRQEGHDLVLILDTDTEAFRILIPALVLEADRAPLATLIAPWLSLDAFTNQIEETRAAQEPKEQGNE